MKSKLAVGLLAATMTFGGVGVAIAQRVTACPNENACAQLAVTPAEISAVPGQIATIGLSFTQAPDNGQGGGADDIAAIAVTLGLQGGSCSGGTQRCAVTSDCPIGETCTPPATTPLSLADCALGADGLPASVKPTALLNGYRVVVENATCGAGRNHCLCPDGGSGIVPDAFINLVVFGPNPLPTPSTDPVVIPELPSGELLMIDLRVADGASLPIVVHPYNQAFNAQRPQFTAFASAGDVNAVDQTCQPVSGEAPCAGPSHVSQLVARAAVLAGGEAPSCVGDCDGDGEVFGNEVTVAINIVAGNAVLEACRAADADGDGEVFGNEVTIAINNVANGCPAL